MSHNPYSPPASRVTDIEISESRVQPWQVRVAVYLLWTSLALSMPQIFHGIFKDDAREGRVYTVLMLVFLACMIAFAAWLITSIGRGRRWARIVYAVLTGWSFLRIWPSTQQQFAESWIFGVLFVVTSAMDVAIVALMFLPPSNAWFRPKAKSVR